MVSEVGSEPEQAPWLEVSVFAALPEAEVCLCVAGR